jgi:hypothetical protein
LRFLEKLSNGSVETGVVGFDDRLPSDQEYIRPANDLGAQCSQDRTQPAFCPVPSDGVPDRSSGGHSEPGVREFVREMDQHNKRVGE